MKHTTLQKEDLISIIIPVYNVGDYLNKCLNSIVMQTYKNLEIIVVDDGSTDGSSIICDIWAKKDERIKIIHKKNGGASDARNNGLKIAKGSYIGFVDSDDWIENTMYEELYKAIKKTGCDVAVCGYNEIDMDSTIKDKEFSHTMYDYSGSEFAMKIISGMSYSVWKNLYRKELLEKKEFIPGVFHEDVVFSTQVYWEANRIVYIDKPLYNYLRRDTSVTGVLLSKKHVLDYIKVLTIQIAYLKNKVSEDWRQEFYWISLYELKAALFRQGRNKELLRLVNLELSHVEKRKVRWKNKSIKKRIKLFLMFRCIPLYVIITSILNKKQDK